MATSSFINGMSLKNKEEVKRFCEILSSKPKKEMLISFTEFTTKTIFGIARVRTESIDH